MPPLFAGAFLFAVNLTRRFFYMRLLLLVFATHGSITSFPYIPFYKPGLLLPGSHIYAISNGIAGD